MQLAMKFAILAAIAQAMFAAASPVYSEEDTNLPERRELSLYDRCKNARSHVQWAATHGGLRHGSNV